MQEPVELKGLIYDNTSGAREIAVRSLQFLQRLATQSSAERPGELRRELGDACVQIARSKPEMAVVFACLNRFLLGAENLNASLDVGEFRIQAVARLQDAVRRLDADIAAAAEHAAALIQNGDVVLAYSRSSSVLAALRAAKASGKLFDVVTTEARPNLEGRALAQELAELQIPVRLLVDALVGTAVEGADHVFVGADAVTARGVVNKAGTRLLALAAREHRVPLHVVADTSKAWLKRGAPTTGVLSGRLHDPKEVWDAPPHGAEVVNLYFDETPIELCTDLVCEHGALDAAGFWERVRADGISERFREEFGDELARPGEAS